MSRQNKAKVINKNDVSNENTSNNRNYSLELFLGLFLGILMSVPIIMMSRHQTNEKFIDLISNPEKINIIDNGIYFNVDEKLCNTLKNEVLSIKGNVYINDKEVNENTECSTYNEETGKIIFKKQI